MTQHLVDYLFVDRRRLDDYFEQIIPAARPRRRGKSTEKVSLSVTGPSVETSIETAEPSTHDKIVALRTLLALSGNLLGRRPPQIPDRGTTRLPQFVLERMRARKVILPRQLLSAVPSLREFSVWVSDPDPDDFTDGHWDFCGTFLYLTEMFIDEGVFGTTYSGCSALQALLNAATGRPFLERNFDEPYGRYSALHPVEKLTALGAQTSDERTIDVLYRPRYMTNEQCYVIGGTERRVHDLLAYPIYIAAAG